MKDTQFAWLIVILISVSVAFTGYADNRMEEIRKAQKEMVKCR